MFENINRQSSVVGHTRGGTPTPDAGGARGPHTPRRTPPGTPRPKFRGACFSKPRRCYVSGRYPILQAGKLVCMIHPWHNCMTKPYGATCQIKLASRLYLLCTWVCTVLAYLRLLFAATAVAALFHQYFSVLCGISAAISFLHCCCQQSVWRSVPQWWGLLVVCNHDRFTLSWHDQTDIQRNKVCSDKPRILMVCKGVSHTGCRSLRFLFEHGSSSTPSGTVRASEFGSFCGPAS